MKVSTCNLCVYDSSFVCIASLSVSSLSLRSTERRRRNKAEQPSTGPYVRGGRLYFNAKEEIHVFKGEAV